MQGLEVADRFLGVVGEIFGGLVGLFENSLVAVGGGFFERAVVEREQLVPLFGNASTAPEPEKPDGATAVQLCPPCVTWLS